MKFRVVQALTIGAVLVQWAVRSLAAPTFHWHATMLWMALLAAASSEVGYRAGLWQRGRSSEN